MTREEVGSPPERSVLAAVIATVGVVATSGAKQAASASPRPPTNTVKVEEQILSATVSLDGTLTYRAQSDGSPYSVINQDSGTYTSCRCSDR